jgi:hypothetical protein
MKNTIITLCYLLLTQLLAAQTVDETRYAWEFPVVRRAPGAEPLIEILREEVDRILVAGPLAPLYVSFADQESVGYQIYQEPGRIITTLAWAYPWLDEARQTAVRSHVNALFTNDVHSPWGITAQGKNGNSNYPLPMSAGAPREEHPKERWWHANPDFGRNRPFLHTLYGVWLYGFRSDDWTAIDANWNAIRDRYNAYATTTETRLYGGMGVHIAIARLAERQGDTTTRDAALLRLRNALAEGLDLDAIETHARGTPGLEWNSPYGNHPSMYDARMDGSTYRGWIFLNIAPEIGRYLREENAALRTTVLARNAQGKTAFPLWWMPKMNYFNRSWTGDEGTGLLTEVLGMIAPIERWVLETPATDLARWTRGAPHGVGDAYWLESLVQAIEAHGDIIWRDVRHPHRDEAQWRQDVFGPDADHPDAQPWADWNTNGFPNILERALGRDPRAPLPGFLSPDIDENGHLRLAYTLAKDVWDFDLRIESSTNLVEWGHGPGHTLPVEQTDLGTTWHVIIRDDVSADTTLRFLRLTLYPLEP